MCDGLSGRRLTLLTNAGRSKYSSATQPESTDDTATSTILVSARDMKIYLKGYVDEVLEPFYVNFNFATLNKNMLTQETETVISSAN